MSIVEVSFRNIVKEQGFSFAGTVYDGQLKMHFLEVHFIVKTARKHFFAATTSVEMVTGTIRASVAIRGLALQFAKVVVFEPFLFVFSIWSLGGDSHASLRPKMAADAVGSKALIHVHQFSRQEGPLIIQRRANVHDAEQDKQNVFANIIAFRVIRAVAMIETPYSHFVQVSSGTQHFELERIVVNRD